jgi:hypothetical protein
MFVVVRVSEGDILVYAVCSLLHRKHMGEGVLGDAFTCRLQEWVGPALEVVTFRMRAEWSVTHGVLS